MGEALHATHCFKSSLRVATGSRRSAGVGGHLFRAAIASPETSLSEFSSRARSFPPKQILISLQTHGGTINSVYSDSQGRFGFYAIPGGMYALNVQDDDYMPVTQEVTLDLSVMTVARTSITLDPRSTAEKKPAGKRVAGSNPNAIDIGELSRRFPPRALKEYEKGLKSNSDGDSQGATLHFQKSVKAWPPISIPRTTNSVAATWRNRFHDAQHEFEEVIRLNQSDAEATLNLGNVFLLTNHLSEALVQVQEGLRRDPESAVGQFVLGSVYQKMHEPEESERALQEALRRFKMNKVHLALVNLYLSQNKKPEAISS